MEWLMLVKNIGFIKVILLRQRWKSVDMPKAVDFNLIQMFIGPNPGNSVFYYMRKTR